MSQAKTQQQPAEAPEYPSWWDWEEDGETVAGTFIRIDRGYTAMGERPFVVLDVNGAPRTVWLHWEALRNQFVREVQRRPDRAIHTGERVTIWNLGTRKSSNDRTYVDFRTDFPDAPEASQVDILGVAAPATGGEITAPEGDGDDTPF